MKLVKIHGGLGEFSLSTGDNIGLDDLFSMFDAPAKLSSHEGRGTVLYRVMTQLFPNVVLLRNDLGGFTAYRRGLIPYHCTGEGQQIITPVEPPLQHIERAELRLIKGESGYFATVAFPGYKTSCVDDVADGLCRKTALDGGPLRAIAEIPRDNQEYGLAAIPLIEQIRETYFMASHLLARSKEKAGVAPDVMEILRKLKHSRNHHDRALGSVTYDPALEKLVRG